MQRYVNSMIVDLIVKKVHQHRRPATNIKKIKLFSARDPVDDPRGLFEPKVRPRVVQVFFNPKISFVILVVYLSHYLVSFVPNGFDPYVEPVTEGRRERSVDRAIAT